MQLTKGVHLGAEMFRYSISEYDISTGQLCYPTHTHSTFANVVKEASKTKTPIGPKYSSLHTQHNVLLHHSPTENMNN
jgi:hypothetical protein